MSCFMHERVKKADGTWRWARKTDTREPFRITFTHGGVLTIYIGLELKLVNSHFLCYCCSQLFLPLWLMSLGALLKIYWRWNNLLLLHWWNPRQSITCLLFERNSEAQPGKGVSHSSAAHCALPWCVFADWREGFHKTIISHMSVTDINWFRVKFEKERTSFLLRMTFFCKTLTA